MVEDTKHRVMTIKEVAAELRVSIQSIHNLIDSNSIRTTYVGKKKLILREAMEEYLEQMTTKECSTIEPNDAGEEDEDS